MEKQMNLIKVYTIVVSLGGRERERERDVYSKFFYFWGNWEDEEKGSLKSIKKMSSQTLVLHLGEDPEK